MNRTVTYTLLATSLTLCWWVVELRGKSRRDEATMVELQRARDIAIAENAKRELASIEESTGSIPKERDAAVRTNAAKPVADRSAEKLTNSAIGILDGQEISPAMREAMRSMMKAKTLEQFSSDYAPLFKRWNLSEADMNTLLGLLPGLEMDASGYLVAHPKAAKLKPEEIAAEAANLRAEIRGKLNALLGAELTAELDNFTGELKVNNAVAPYTKHLDLVGVPMNQEQKSMLAEAISSGGGENIPASPDPVPPDVLRRQHEAQQAAIIQRVGGFLSPEQITALQTVFTRKNDEQEAVGKMLEDLIKESEDE